MDVQPPPSDAEPLIDPDRRLIERAREATEAAFDPDHFDGAYMVGAAVRTDGGEVFTGVSQPAGVGRASVCAEPSALSAARIAGADGFAASAAVRHPLPDEDREFEVVSACGVCRELLCDYVRRILCRDLPDDRGAAEGIGRVAAADATLVTARTVKRRAIDTPVWDSD